MEATAQVRIEIGVVIRAIAVEEAGYVPHRGAVDHRAPYQRSNLLSRERASELARFSEAVGDELIGYASRSMGG